MFVRGHHARKLLIHKDFSVLCAVSVLTPRTETNLGRSRGLNSALAVAEPAQGGKAGGASARGQCRAIQWPQRGGADYVALLRATLPALYDVPPRLAANSAQSTSMA